MRKPGAAGQGRLAGRLALRIALAGGVRSGLAAGVVIVLVGCVVAGLYLLTALTATAQQRANYLTGGAPAAVSVQPTEAAAAEVLAALPADVDAELVLGADEMPVARATAVRVGRLVERDWGAVPELADALYRTVDGQLPATTGEVALTRPLAAWLGAVVGDQVQLAYDTNRSLVVSGIVELRAGHSALRVLTATGTRWSLAPPSGVAEWFGDTVVLELRGAVTQDVLQQVASFGPVIERSGFSEPQPIYQTQQLLLGIPVMLVIGVAVGAVLIARMRRLRQDYSVLLSVGAGPDLVARSILLGNLVLVALGLVAGWLLGWLAALVLRAPVERLADADVVLRSVGASTAVALAVVVMGALILVSGWTRRVVAQDEEMGAGLRPVTETTQSRRSGRTWVRRIVQLGAAGSVVFAVVATPEDTTGFAILAGAAGLLAVATVPDGFAVAAMLHRFVGPAPRYALRLVERDGVRGMVIAAVVAFALVSPLTLQSAQASVDSQNESVHRWRVLPGQLGIRTGVLDSAAIQALQSAAGAPVVPLYSLDAILPGFQRDGNVMVVDSIDDYQAVTGYRPTEAERTAVSKGTVVTFDPGVVGRDRIRLQEPGSDSSIVVPAVTASGSQAVPRGDTWGAVMVRSAAEKAGLVVSVNGYRILGGMAQLPDVRQAAVEHQLLPTQITVAQGPPVTATVTSRVATYAGAILALLLSVGVVLLGMREWRPNFRQLNDVGSGRWSLLAAGAVLMALPALVGAVFGCLIGVLTSAVRVARMQIPLALPWGWYAAMAGGLIVVLAVVGAVVAAFSLPRDSNVTAAHEI